MENKKIPTHTQDLSMVMSIYERESESTYPCERSWMSPRGGVNRRFKNNYGLGLNKCGIKLAFNLSSTKPKSTRLTLLGNVA